MRNIATGQALTGERRERGDIGQRDGDIGVRGGGIEIDRAGCVGVQGAERCGECERGGLARACERCVEC
ncbi:MAG: hypothetical protein B7X48_07895 [Acidiphilium sp. 34-60-192]|nr:MAG: hypothetical protein B7X48_07895 [Acidiphilium sp. 34-60-192]